MNNLLAIFLITLNVINAFELDVYRMVGIEQESNWTGSKIASFQLLTTHWSELAQRKVALIKFSELTLNNILELISNKPSGVLIILDTISESLEQTTWDLLITHLGPKGSTIPIYFTYESQQINEHYLEITNKSEQEYQLQVSSTDQKLQLTLEDSYNLLESISNFKQNNPSTMIVLGIDQNLPSAEIIIPKEKFGLQVSIFFKLARELKYQSRFERNIIFYVTTSQSLDEFGLKQFYKKQEYQRIVSTIDTIIILGEIQQNEYLTISHNVQIKEKLQSYLFGMQYQLEESETTNISNKEIDTIRIYTHKQMNILSQNENSIQQDNQNIVLNLISQLIDEKPFQSQHDDQLFDSALNQFINQINRHPSNLQKDSKFLNEFNGLLKQLFKHTTKVQYIIKDRKFYTSTQLKGQIIKFYSAFVDLYLIVGVSGWLSIIYIIIRYIPIFRNDQSSNKKRR